MRRGSKTAVAVLFCGMTFCAAIAQQETVASANEPGTGTHRTRTTKVRTLTSDERLAVLASALDSKTPRLPEYDCSHLVHAIYERAGFSYAYASSDDLYDGVEGFQRISRPETGDVVVWHGHMGIVIRPSRHVFFSFLHAGPGVDDYRSRYWRSRGEPRFYRYIKNDRCAGCRLASSRTGEWK
jgi:cell wall-associated NlpC family hydrolase